jgi:hypothetical protein
LAFVGSVFELPAGAAEFFAEEGDGVVVAEVGADPA